MMKKYILTILCTGIICGVIGFKQGRSGMLPATEVETYRLKVERGVRDYKTHYFATRKEMAEFLKHLDDAEQRFYREMPDAHKKGPEPTQYVIDLFGNLDKREKIYLGKTKNWDAQVEGIEVSITSTRPKIHQALVNK